MRDSMNVSDVPNPSVEAFHIIISFSEYLAICNQWITIHPFEIQE